MSPIERESDTRLSPELLSMFKRKLIQDAVIGQDFTYREGSENGGFGQVRIGDDPRWFTRDGKLREPRTIASKFLVAVPPVAPGNLQAEALKLRLVSRRSAVVDVLAVHAIDNWVAIHMEVLPSTLAKLYPGPEQCASWSEAMTIGLELCTGLSDVHRAGIIHGDLKPENIGKRASGEYVLFDFGISRFMGLDKSNPIWSPGTFGYIRPERWDPTSMPKPEWDLHALGALLYRIMSGVIPPNDLSTLEERLRELRSPDPIPERMVRLIVASVRPAEGFKSAAAFQSALRAIEIPLSTGTPESAPRGCMDSNGFGKGAQVSRRPRAATASHRFAGYSPELLGELREALLQCKEFADHPALRHFVELDHRLALWAKHIPFANDQEVLVNGAIRAFSSLRHPDIGESGIVLLLEALARSHSGDALRNDLSVLATNCRHWLSGESQF